MASGGVNEFLRKIRSGDIARQVRGRPAGLPNGGFGFRGRSRVQIVDHHGGARGGEFFGDGAADATARAGDEGYFGIERKGHKNYETTDGLVRDVI